MVRGRNSAKMFMEQMSAPEALPRAGTGGGNGRGSVTISGGAPAIVRLQSACRLLAALLVAVASVANPVTAADLNTALRAAQLLQAGSEHSVAQQIAALDQQLPVAPPGHPYQERLARVVAYLGDVNGRQLRYQVYLVNNINAMAFPTGEIRVFAGLMDLLDDEELTFVIGHEIAHVVKDHAMASIGRSRSREMAELAGSILGLKLPGGAARGLSTGADLLELHFSRSAELEADRFGLKLLDVLGLDQRAGVTALLKLARVNGGSSPLGSWFQTHPDPQVRAAELQEALHR
jgi:putative metalloprotease